MLRKGRGPFGVAGFAALVFLAVACSGCSKKSPGRSARSYIEAVCTAQELEHAMATFASLDVKQAEKDFFGKEGWSEARIDAMNLTVQAGPRTMVEPDCLLLKVTYLVPRKRSRRNFKYGLTVRRFLRELADKCVGRPTVGTEQRPCRIAYGVYARSGGVGGPQILNAAQPALDRIIREANMGYPEDDPRVLVESPAAELIEVEHAEDAQDVQEEIDKELRQAAKRLGVRMEIIGQW